MARLLVVVDYQLTGFIEAVNTFCEPLLDNETDFAWLQSQAFITFCEPLLDNEIRNDLFYLNVVFMAEE